MNDRTGRTDPQNPEAPGKAGPEAGSTPVLSSETLLGGAREVLIRHGDETYRLRSTSKGKLILTK